MAVPVVAGHSWEAEANATSWTVTGPSTVTENDLLLMFLLTDESQSNATGSTTGSPSSTGWTNIQDGTDRDGDGDCSAFLLYKVASASDASGAPVDYTVNFDATDVQGISHIVRVTGVDTTTPINASSVQTTAAGAASITLPGITTTVADCLLLAFTGVDESSAAMEPYWADPMITGWTQHYGSLNATYGYTQGSSSVYSGIAASSQASAGATGDKVASIDVEDDAIVGFLVAVAPAAGGTNYSETVNDDGTAGDSVNTSLVSASSGMLSLLAAM